jgi:hypothetical protein
MKMKIRPEEVQYEFDTTILDYGNENEAIRGAICI